MESLYFAVICFLICADTFQVNSLVLNKERSQNNLSSRLESDQLVPVSEDLNSKNVSRVKKSPAAAPNSPYTTTVCVQVRPDNTSSQQCEGNQKLPQESHSRSDNGMLNQHFIARVAQKNLLENNQANAFEHVQQMPVYTSPSRQSIQAPQAMQFPLSFLQNQNQQLMIQKNSQARNKEAEQSLPASSGYFNPQITDRQLAQIRPLVAQIDHQQDEIIQRPKLDKNAKLMGNQYYRAYDTPDKRIGTLQVLPSSLTKQYVLSSYPRSQTNTGGPAELITSTVPLTLNCDVYPDASPKEAIKIAQYTTPKQNQAQQNFYSAGSAQGMNQMFPFLQDPYRQQQIEYMRSNANAPWAKEIPRVDPYSVIYKGEPIVEQMDEPKVMMDEMGRSVVYWRDQPQMFTPIYKYGLDEERKSSGRDNQFPGNQEKMMNTDYVKHTVVADNGNPGRALTEEELKIKEKNIEEQLKKSQARLQELQKQLKESNMKMDSKDTTESETEETGKPTESPATTSSSATKTPPGSAKRSVPRQRNVKRQN